MTETVTVSLARYVTIKSYAASSGLSEGGIRKRIDRGVWIEGREWRRAPDGRIMIDTKGVEKWIETETA